MAINWVTIGREGFERAVELLAYHEFPSAKVHGVNGRGGDQGRDIQIFEGARVTVCQLKYFPEGISSSRSRRPQIRKSWERVKDQDIHEWILVVPATLTIGERDFVQQLGADSEIITTVWDRTRLDAMLARYPDVSNYLKNQCERFREDVVLFNAEKAALTGGLEDATERIGHLFGQVNSLDPHWAIDISSVKGVTGYSFRPKHANSSTVKPINLKLFMEFAPEHASLQSDLASALQYGALKPVHLPMEVVTDASVSGLEWLTQAGPAQVSLLPSPSPQDGKPCRISLTNDGRVRSYKGIVSQAASGVAGFSIVAKFFGIVSITTSFPKDENQSASVNFSCELANADPEDVDQGLRLLEHLTGCDSVSLHVDGERICTGSIVGGKSEEHGSEFAAIRQFASDLAVIGTATDNHLLFPKDVSALDRIHARVARLLLEGCVVRAPAVGNMTIEFNGEDDPGIRAVLDGNPVSIRTGCATYPLSIAGKDIDVGPLAVWHSSISVENRAEALACLDRGDAGGFKLKLHPSNGEPLLLALFTQMSEHSEIPVDVTDWGLLP